MEEIEDIKTKWYVVQVMSGKENIVFRTLDFICSEDPANVVLPPDGVKKRFHSVFRGLVHGIYEINIPIEIVNEFKNGDNKKKATERKLYPGYVLFRMYVEGEDGSEKMRPADLSFIKDTKGVISFIGGERGKDPVPLSPEEADGMMKVRNEADEGVVKPKVIYNVGETVKIINGGFKDMDGVIEAIDEERGRLTLSVFCFGRYNYVDIDFGQVERAQE
jgi:transcriptional antiterminator NusG